MSDNLYQIQSPDATEYWIKMIKCQDACPVHTDACGYVTAIAEGRDEDAYDTHEQRILLLRSVDGCAVLLVRSIVAGATSISPFRYVP